ncbi:uncharacterized protein BXIN_1553 [Babesia sp. Xinjiang]|uniref:uncharacterized protein n=1 Tax=Babesia sp. Xinjiang TaxID=462227 RepID=UPI000A253B10|nr:uncharacterized protein BXIN_1553 [Babesia sp. Xinjiang]ORM42313.1 hypothetical protein BXIN_1553 [Babesia sp. Xinjiang]
MPISYCCHLISAIELRYASDTRIPAPILRAFKHPRIYDNNRNISPCRSETLDTEDGWIDDVAKCNRILEPHGYSLIRQGDAQGLLTISRFDYREREGRKRLRDQHGNHGYDALSSSSTATYGGALHHITEIVRQAMLYHICLFDEFSQDFEQFTYKTPQSSREPRKIRKNSAYEMSYALKDCLTQLRKKIDDAMEAVLITEEYSGIFTNEEVVITRSTMGFRNLLVEEGIKFCSVYDATASPSSPTVLNDTGESHDDLVSCYLKAPVTCQSQESRETWAGELTIVEYSEQVDDAVNEHISKETFFKALNLPLTDENDINLIFVRGRIQCGKLLRFLEKQCRSTLLKLQEAGLHVAHVKFVLSNFPVLFSKLQELRVCWHEVDSNTKDEQNKVSIKGLVLPSVLNRLFKAVRRMQGQGIIKDASLTVDYNTEIDSELHEDCLQISDSNRIYNNFIANMSAMERHFQHIYGVLRKMVPYTYFVVHKGRVSVPARGALRKQGSVALLQSINNAEVGSRTVHLADIPRYKQQDWTAICRTESETSSNIVILKDTLYTNLAAIKFTVAHLENANTVNAIPTKVLVDESLARVSSVETSCALEHPYNLKCYVDLYPAVDHGRSHGIMDVVQPYHLSNLVWLMGYLLHCGSYLPLLDRQCMMENGSDHFRGKPNAFNFSSTRSNAEDLHYPVEEVFQTGKFKFDASVTGSDPLAQQSYVIKLASRVTFNKRFLSVFGLSYSEHIREKLQRIRNRDVKRKAALDTYHSDSCETLLMPSGNLTRSWESLLQRSQNEASALNGSQSSYQDIDDSYVVNGAMSHDELIDGESTQRLNYRENSNSSIGLLNKYTSTTPEEELNPRLRSSDSFGSVSSAARAHGRLHHCFFNFDTKAPFKDSTDLSILQQEIENVYVPDDAQGNRRASKRHIVFVFLTARAISPLVSSRIKLVKDVINSSDIAFLYDDDPKLEQPMEYNALNAQSYTESFKSDSVATTFGQFYAKGNISYSFLDKDLVCDLYYICMEGGTIATKPFSRIDSQQSILSASTGGIHRRELREHFVSYSWICDAYFAGCIDLRCDVPSIHSLRVTDGEISDPFYFPRDSSVQKSNDDWPLEFLTVYRNVKFLWGWYIYVLSLPGQVFSDGDALLYKKHCGIRIASHESLHSIANDIKTRLEDDMQRFNLAENDVTLFLSHPRIYTNTIVLVGDHTLQAAESEREKEAWDYRDGCLRVMFGGKLVSFGKYEGIPLLKLSWITDTLQHAKPAPLSNYGI